MYVITFSGFFTPLPPQLSQLLNAIWHKNLQASTVETYIKVVSYRTTIHSNSVLLLTCLVKNASKLGAHSPIYCFIKQLRHPKRISFSNRILTFFPIPLVQGTELQQPVAQMANPFFFPLTWHKPLERKPDQTRIAPGMMAHLLLGRLAVSRSLGTRVHLHLASSLFLMKPITSSQLFLCSLLSFTLFCGAFFGTATINILQVKRRPCSLQVLHNTLLQTLTFCSRIQLLERPTKSEFEFLNSI